MTHRWLVLDICGPLMAFGGVAIDHVGPVRDFPAASMLTGLLANALGWHWRDTAAHQGLQDRLVFAARLEEEGRPVTDSQNAKLEKTDRGWTSSGIPEGRDGASYNAPHRRRRDYRADARVLVVLRLLPGEGPDLDALAGALRNPARPLFIGRKPCLPSRPLLDGRPGGLPVRIEAPTAHAALAALGEDERRAQWPEGEGPDGDHRIDLADLRNWRTGLHGGARPVLEGRISPRDRKAAS